MKSGTERMDDDDDAAAMIGTAGVTVRGRNRAWWKTLSAFV